MMLLSPHPHHLPLRSLPFHTNKLHSWQHHHLPTPKPKKLRLSLHESAEFITQNQQQLLNPNSLFLLTETTGYSLASYYTSLGLFVISVPGLWSLIKRSVKSKVIHSFIHFHLVLLLLLLCFFFDNFVFLWKNRL